MRAGWRGQIRNNQFMAPAPGSTATRMDVARVQAQESTPDAFQLRAARVVPNDGEKPIRSPNRSAAHDPAGFQAWDFVSNQVALLAEPDINRFNHFPAGALHRAGKPGDRGE